MPTYKRSLISAGVLLAATALSTSVSAHHSKAMFDDSKCLTLQGTVRNFEWQYPHSWLWIVVPTGGGAGEIWAFESMSPSQLVEVDPRWTQSIVAVGDKVTVRFSPLKDGRHGGSMNTVTLPDGRVLLGAPNSCLGAAAVYGGSATKDPTPAKSAPPPAKNPPQ